MGAEGRKAPCAKTELKMSSVFAVAGDKLMREALFSSGILPY